MTANILWPDADLSASRDRLSQALVWLRRQLEPEGVEPGSILFADRTRIGLNPAAVTTDIADFESLLASHASAPLSALRERLIEAVSLYRGDLLTGLYQDWALTERQRLKEAYLRTLHRLVLLEDEEGLMDSALHYARLAVATDPLHEEAHGDLIRILAASGETSAALRQFQNLKTILEKEFSTGPSAASLAIMEAIRQPPAARPQPAERRERLPLLPVPLTRFFGRESEIEDLCRILQPGTNRLVTLLGTGGAGKTRLSLCVSARLVQPYEGAVAFIALADLADANLIPAVIAAALNLPEATATLGSSLTAIVDALARRPFLLVLDNLEHVLAEISPLVRELLQRVPTLTVLATSRQRLGIEGEQEVAISSLALPELTDSSDTLLQSASVQLFLDRARLARPDFTLSNANASAVARVVARLDGIPLAIELCAAWAQMLTPSQMLEKLDRRFDLLVSRRTDITPRHRTLRAALEYSYLQLPTELQRLFARLSVFRGGWSLDAAVAAATEVENSDPLALLADLNELRERSLIGAEEVSVGDDGTEMRYRILETLREFAGEQLSYADRGSRRRAHAHYFVHLAEDAGTPIARLEQEQDNLRAALGWSLELSETEIGLRLGGALRRYWSVRGRLAEGYDWLRRLFDQAQEGGSESSLSERVRATAWNTRGYLAWAQGNYGTALDAHQKALAHFRHLGDGVGVGESLYYLGITRYRQDAYPDARVFFAESLSIARERDDTAGIARVLLNLGNIAYEEQHYEEADTFFQKSLVLEQSLGNQQRVANALNNLGLIAMARKEYEKAGDLFERALTISRQLNDTFSVANFIMNRGTVARLRNKREDAWALLTEGLKLAHDVGNKHILSHYLLQLGLLESGAGKPVHCVFLLSTAQHLIENLHTSVVSHPEDFDQAMAAARDALGEARYTGLVDLSRREALSQTVAEVLSWRGDSSDIIFLENNENAR